MVCLYVFIIPWTYGVISDKDCFQKCDLIKPGGKNSDQRPSVENKQF